MIRSALIAAVLGGALLLGVATAVPASDDDEDPPYLIYVDPETGKYTTVDPAAARSESGSPAQPLVPQDAGPGDPRSEGGRSTPRGWFPAAALVVALLLLAGLRCRARRRSDRSLMNARVTARSAR